MELELDDFEFEGCVVVVVLGILDIYGVSGSVDFCFMDLLVLLL